MKFRRTPQFREDYRSLSDEDRQAVDEAFGSVAEALQGNIDAFSRHRLRRMEGAPGIWEGHVRQNLCFTFHYDYTKEGEKICMFRRIGTHAIYEKP